MAGNRKGRRTENAVADVGEPGTGRADLVVNCVAGAGAAETGIAMIIGQQRNQHDQRNCTEHPERRLAQRMRERQGGGRLPLKTSYLGQIRLHNNNNSYLLQS